MKIKEVCGRTGLTQRAVRFYVEQGLVSPAAAEINGRTYLEFSERDAARLSAIATLRKAGYTLEELRAMAADFAGQAPQAARTLQQRLDRSAGMLRRVRAVPVEEAGSLEEYAGRLERNVGPAPLPKTDRGRGPAWAWRWPGWAETVCMVLSAILGWKVYLFLYRPLDTVLFSNGLSAVSVLALPMLYLMFVLPLSLVLGSKFGRWLGEHLLF